LILVSLVVVGVAIRHHSRHYRAPGLPEAISGSAVAALGVQTRTPALPDAPLPVAGGGSPDGVTPLSLVAQRSTLPGVSSLWTPEGEHRVRPAGDDHDSPRAPSRPDDAGAPDGGPGGAPPPSTGADDLDLDDLDPEEKAELAERLDELRRQLLSTPAEVVVANHAYGLFELAAIHLSQQPPRRDQARLAVDGMAALVEGLEGRLGEAERPLNDALAQIRLAFIQISEAAAANDDKEAGDPEP
jgi:hypothetical protein